MDNILKFLDFASVDAQMYWRIPGIDPQKSYEIQWRRDGNFHWRFRSYGDVLWNLGDPENLLSQLAHHGIDTEIFARQVKNSLLHQICYADRIVSDARQFLGSEDVDHALEEHRNFIRSIEETVAEFLPPPVEERSPLAKGTQLRLIKT